MEEQSGAVIGATAGNGDGSFAYFFLVLSYCGFKTEVRSPRGALHVR